MSEQRIFFKESQNSKIFKATHKFLETLEFDNDIEPVRLRLNLILGFITQDGDFFDKNCQLSIGWIGDTFVRSLEKINTSASKNPKDDFENDDIESLIKESFAMAYRFLCEAEFRTPNGLNHSLMATIEKIDDSLHIFNESQKRDITVSRLILPSYILKQFIHHENIQSIIEFNKNISAQQEKQNEWIKEISSRQTAVNQLKSNLEEYKKAFNFVGLHKGFDDLSAQKRKEQTWALGFLIVLGFLTLSPVGIEIFLFLFRTAEIQKYSTVLVYAIVPTITIQLVLIYFFRVALMNYKSIKAQLLQLELRKTLCSFIQSYTSYAKEMKSNDNASLDKFENLIFSGIIANEEQLPSTFDGIEQFGKIMQSLKSVN